MSEEASWMEDPEEFERRWKLSFEDFRVLIQALPPDIAGRYERTLRADEEAAITWVLAYAKKSDLLAEDEVPAEPGRALGSIASGDPEPKFRIGDVVTIADRGKGTVSFVGQYDAYIGQYRYKVATPDGNRLTYNENSLKRRS
jgi:hypothetical protein